MSDLTFVAWTQNYIKWV